MLENSHGPGTPRRSRDEILDLFRACRAKLGRTPGQNSFFKMARIGSGDVGYYWPRYSALVREAGAQPNEFQLSLPDEEVFLDYARVCLKLGKIPTRGELRIAERELATKTSRVYSRFGTIGEFDERFRLWLEGSSADLKAVLRLPGWRTPASQAEITIEEDVQVRSGEGPGLHLYLPYLLQYLGVLARGERPPFESSELHVNTLFERRTAEAFRCLGFEIASFGQGTGRNADVVALARRERFAVIIDAKVRSGGYVLGTEDRKFLEYARSHGGKLQREGFEKIYFVVVAPSFKERDLEKLTEALSDSPIRSVNLLSASALMRLVEESIRERATFKLADLERQFFRNKIISE